MKIKKLISVIAFVAGSFSLTAQQPVAVGSGSYAEYTPLFKSATDQHGGDKSRIMETRRIYVSDKKKGEPVPTNDWWTNLLVDTYSGNLWTYPQVVKAEGYGIFVAYPNHWSDDGCEMKWDTQLTIKGRKFHPEEAIADDWSDWGLRMQLADGDKRMNVTMAQGVPFTWVEAENLDLQLEIGGGELSMQGETAVLPIETDRLVVKIGDDLYAVFAPDATLFEQGSEGIDVTFAEDKPHYLAISVLPDEEAVDFFAQYASVVPRQTKVDWTYNEKTGKMTSTWTVTTENLDGESERNILQGFIPHHYKYSENDIQFTEYAYATPRGKMKMATGNTFSTSYHFSGILPWFAAPEEMADLAKPYNRERMKQMIADYAAKGSFGADTYWGGKGLIQMALNMAFAKELGEDELFEQCRSRLREVMENWLTYTPGEQSYFFARYDRWGALVGYDTSYDSDTFNDHHFHYGYFTYAGALLALVDSDFRAKYGEMLKLIAKDYANWDRADKRFPPFRTFSPWSGHSYAGGLGNTGNGNGQESTSEAMQGWGGMYLLGVALGDKQMRDAGIFGWVTESKGVAEYWFDRDKENIDRSLYTHPYNSNLTAAGIGWWTWFSGDPVWMHSIQWMPISPCLDYLSEDLEFAKWDYEQMWAGKEIGGWESDPDFAGSALSKESGLGNVVLSYLQRFDPDEAARIFDEMWDAGTNVARSTDTNGITYYITHSHRTYGDRDFAVNADIPTSSAYCDGEGKYTYVVFNPEASERTVTFYRDGAPLVSFKAPAGKLTVYASAPEVSAIKIESPAIKTVEPGKNLQLKAVVTDQYGATVDGAELEWSVDGSFGSISADGLFTAGSEKAESCKVKATCGELSDEITLRIGDAPVIADAEITPALDYVVAGETVSFGLTATDQYGDPVVLEKEWLIEKDGKTVKNDSIFDLDGIGIYTVKVKAGDNTYARQFYATPQMDNLALHKTVDVSSEENVGLLKEYATDGDMQTRWSSSATDNEWISVDLGKTVYVNDVTIHWEAAYATRYTVQISGNGDDWENVADVNGNGGAETTEIRQDARFIRIDCQDRATDYGYSIYEIEAHGIDPDADKSQLMGMEIVAPTNLLKEGEAVQLSAKGYDGNGNEMEVAPQWSVDASSGTITADGIFTPAGYGNVTVTATAEGKTATADFVVEESIKPRSVAITPAYAQIVKGESISFGLEVLDQFSTPCGAEGFTFSCEAASDMLDGNVFTGLRNGTYSVIASNGDISATATVTVDEFAGTNLALGKDVYASSYENDGTLPGFANDGNLSTRWGSGFDDNQYLVIDLGVDYVLDRVVLHWNAAAYSTDYRVEVSADDDTWTVVGEAAGSAGGVRTHTFGKIAGRYVRIYCMKRSSIYGSCLDEVEVYGTAKYENPEASALDIVADNGFAAYIGETVLMEASITDQYGLAFDPQYAIEWTVDNDCAEISADGTLTPLKEGECTVTAAYAGLSDAVSVRVFPERIISGLIVNPAEAEIEAGTELQLEAIAVDQFGNNTAVDDCLWSGDFTGGNGVFEADEEGRYEVTAEYHGMKASVVITVVGNLENVALNKPISDINDGNSATAANDGNDGSRWIGAGEEDALTIDLQGFYHLMRSSILWERAAAADYDILVSSDGDSWVTAYSASGYGDTGANRTDEFRMDCVCRYVRLLCKRKATQWDYSVYEWQLFGRKMVAGEPCAITIVDGATSLAVGETHSFSAIVTDCDGEMMPDAQIRWTATGGGTISGNGDYEGYVTGEYSVTASAGIISATVPVTVSLYSGVENVVGNVSIAALRKSVAIKSSEPMGQVCVYGVAGNCVFAAQYGSAEAVMDLSSLPGGVYIVKVLGNAVKVMFY